MLTQAEMAKNFSSDYFNRNRRKANLFREKSTIK